MGQLVDMKTERQEANSWSKVSSPGERKSGVAICRTGSGRERSEFLLGWVVIEIPGYFQEGCQKCGSELRDKAQAWRDRF